MGETYELEKMTYLQVKKKIIDGWRNLILPIGTMEAHGNHLPLATDTYIPLEISKRIAPKIKALSAPPLYYGVTRSLLGYHGSSTLKEETMKSVVKEIILSYKRQGFEKFIIMNGHGGNIDVIKNAQYDLWLEHEIKSIRIDWWIFVRKITEETFNMKGAHAGIDETAMILATKSDLVDRSVDFKNETYLYQNGLTVYPFPGTIILYESEDRGLPDFDENKAKEYFDRVVKYLTSKIKEILEKIDNI